MKFTYDKETSILMIALKKGKVVDSDMQNNCVIDYDKNGDICKLEIRNFNPKQIITQ